jgi:NitT/TauT family transport system substrate-binding protein
VLRQIFPAQQDAIMGGTLMHASLRRHAVTLGVLVAGALVGAPHTALALEKLKIAVGQRGAWDSGVSEIGQRAGIFRKHGLELELLYTQGSGETSQAVISGSVDVGISVGTGSAMAAFAKGAPIRIIGAVITGAADLYWYVPTQSPIKTIRDTDGKTIAYSTNGSSTNAVVTALIKELDLKAKPVATGSPSSTLTQTMSGQVDVGWGSPPLGLDLIDQKRIRVIASGNDTSLKNQSPRIIATTVGVLDHKAAAIASYMDAYRETVRFMTSDDAALDIYAKWMNLDPAIARRSRDDFFPKGALDPDRINGLDSIMSDAVRFKYIAAPLTQAQIADLIRIPAPKTAK